jgi:cytochrome c553
MTSRLNGVAWLASAALCSIWSLSARAAGDPALGAKKFYTCYGCHGIDSYRNAFPDYSVPKLRHQDAAYIISALHEYKSGDRPHPTMHAQASSLSDQDIEDIAAYLQGPEPPKPTTAAADKAPKQVVACAACHGANGTGVENALTPKPAILAGQHEDYLEQALQAYKNGRRKNIVMNGMAKLLATDEDVRIAAEYFSSRPSSLVAATP